MGRSMQNALLNMDLEENYKQAISEIGYTLEDLYEEEGDAALGNGGLGRLAACFLDSMATLELPAWGYGIRYDYGIFKQVIRDGAQVEVPDYWLTFGNPWEIARQDVIVPVRFYGSTRTETDSNGHSRVIWEGGETVVAMAYDNPIPGYDTWNTINLRLWKALPAREFDFASFNSGNYHSASEAKERAENISNVLYPSDSTYQGKELRLKQQYFFVCATLHDVVRRFKKIQGFTWEMFSDKNAIQLNDTHPSIAIAELMRILVDYEGVEWSRAWDITVKSFGYTNHTILPEALEKWTVDLMGSLLPRHLEIIYKINWHFIEQIKAQFGEDWSRIRRMSIIDENGTKSVRMAHLAVFGSHVINGVAALHSELVKSDVFPDFYQMMPERFQNKTNGVTSRRWINQANPKLRELITKWIGTEEWIKNLSIVSGLRPVADNKELQAEWRAVKTQNKMRLRDIIQKSCGVAVMPTALFDVQVKRIHEYKRQQLNAFYCIYRYNWIKSLSPEARKQVVPRVTIFGGKAAPGYFMAKCIIKLIHKIGNIVNNDPDIGNLFKVVFIPNYNVSLAEVIVPASDLSQHISTAGMEASGTSNMKFAMNGGLIIGTMDGANIEIASEIGNENMFVFGALKDEVTSLRSDRRPGSGVAHRPHCAELQSVIRDLESGKYGPAGDGNPLLDTLKWENDYYLVSDDFKSYLAAQLEVDRVFSDQVEWTRRSILSTAGMGKFSTDRTIDEYAREIWEIQPCPRSSPTMDANSKVRSFPALTTLN